MFTKPLTDIDEDDIQALVNHKEQESAELEFKRDIESTDKGKKKLAKHVSAMANANGGIIIFGIEEKESKADKLIGIDEMVGDQPVGEFVNNVLISRVRPRLAVQPQAVKLANGKVVLVLQVSRIPYRPHMVLAENVYYVRHNCSVALADEHEVRAMVLESKSSSDEVKEFLKKRKLDDKDREDFALTPLAKRMRENPLMAKQIPEGHEGKPFVLFASCPRHLEERMDIASWDFYNAVNQSGDLKLFDQNFDFFRYTGSRHITSESLYKIVYDEEDEGKIHRYVEICRNGYVEKGLCLDIITWKQEDSKLRFRTTSFVADFWAYMTFINRLYRAIGYFDELNIIVALSDTKGIAAALFGNKDQNHYDDDSYVSRAGIAQEGNALIERSVVISELGDEQIEAIVKEVVGRVLNHFNKSIEKCLDEEGKFNEDRLRERILSMYWY